MLLLKQNKSECADKGIGKKNSENKKIDKGKALQSNNNANINNK